MKTRSCSTALPDAKRHKGDLDELDIQTTGFTDFAPQGYNIFDNSISLATPPATPDEQRGRGSAAFTSASSMSSTATDASVHTDIPLSPGSPPALEPAVASPNISPAGMPLSRAAPTNLLEAFSASNAGGAVPVTMLDHGHALGPAFSIAAPIPRSSPSVQDFVPIAGAPSSTAANSAIQTVTTATEPTTSVTAPALTAPAIATAPVIQTAVPPTPTAPALAMGALAETPTVPPAAVHSTAIPFPVPEPVLNATTTVTSHPALITNVVAAPTASQTAAEIPTVVTVPPPVPLPLVNPAPGPVAVGGNNQPNIAVVHALFAGLERVPDNILLRLYSIVHVTIPNHNIFGVYCIPSSADWGRGRNERLLCFNDIPVTIWLAVRATTLWFFNGDGDPHPRVNIGFIMAAMRDYEAVKQLYQRARPRGAPATDTIYASRLQTVRERGEQTAHAVAFDEVYDATQTLTVKSAMPRLSAADLADDDIVLVEAMFTRWKKPADKKKKNWPSWDVGFELQAISLIYSPAPQVADNANGGDAVGPVFNF